MPPLGSAGDKNRLLSMNKILHYKKGPPELVQTGLYIPENHVLGKTVSVERELTHQCIYLILDGRKLLVITDIGNCIGNESCN